MGFKERFTQLRKELGLTQEQLAEKLGIGYTRTAISAWEVGRNEPSNSDTIKIADFFGVSTDYLLGKTDVRNIEKFDIDSADIAFFNGISGLNETNKEILKNIYKGLKAKEEQEKKNKK